MVGWLKVWSVGWLVGRSVKVSQTVQETRVGRRLYSVNIQYLLYLSIPTLTQLPSLFAEDVDLRIELDYDKVRKTAKENEYMVPTKLTFTTEPHGMTVQLENLFNGNNLLGK
jgi:preprotein translocase subunit SecB